MADRDECRCEGCGLPNEYCSMLQKGICGTNAELSTAWDKIDKLKVSLSLEESLKMEVVQMWNEAKAENERLKDDIELSDARLLRLAEYINALAEDCDKQSVYLHIHGITDPWAESRKLFDQLPLAVRALLEKLREVSS